MESRQKNQKPTDRPKDRAERTLEGKHHKTEEPAGEDGSEIGASEDDRQPSDQEPSGHSSGRSGNCRTSTPTRSKESSSGSATPTAATYSVDEDHDSLGSPVLKELDDSDEDLFLDLPTPTKRAGKSKSSNNNDNGVRGDDEYSSDEDF